jgi:hypothetical protein
MLVQMPITKGPTLKAMDAHFGGASANYMANYTAALAALQAPGANLLTLAEARFGANSQEVAHFRAHWLGGGNAVWWPNIQPIDPILIAGLVDAITVARAAQVPMHFVWIAGAIQDFRVAYSTSQHQVTVYFLTPDAGAPNPNLDNDVTIWWRDQQGDVTKQSN